jgi:hypothetical protein
MVKIKAGGEGRPRRGENYAAGRGTREAGRKECNAEIRHFQHFPRNYTRLR